VSPNRDRFLEHFQTLRHQLPIDCTEPGKIPARAREAVAHGSVIGVIYHPRILARGVRADVLFMLDDIAASGEFANEEHDPSILPSAHVRVGNAVIRWWSQPTPAAREVVLGCVNDALGYTSSATPVATSQIDQTM